MPRPLLLAAKYTSVVFHPAYYPLLFLTLLYQCTFLEYVSPASQLITLATTALFTIIIPRTLIHLYNLAFRITRRHRMHRHGRIVPYLVHLTSYLLLLHILQLIHAHSLVLDVIIISILIQLCCTITNFFWKVSLHAAGAGAIIGFTLINHIPPTLPQPIPLIIAILLSGMLGTSRLLLRRNTLAQVNAGTTIGIICGIAGTLLSAFRHIF